MAPRPGRRAGRALSPLTARDWNTPPLAGGVLRESGSRREKRQGRDDVPGGCHAAGEDEMWRGAGQGSPHPARGEPRGTHGVGRRPGSRRTSQEEDRRGLGAGPGHRRNEGRAQGDLRAGPQRLHAAGGAGGENGAWGPPG